MVKINRVYTRSGDGGSTSLVGGVRVPKDSLRIETYGTVDELNSAIGAAIASHLNKELHEPLLVIQQLLFNLGAELATPPTEDEEQIGGPVIDEKHVQQLEVWIDLWNENLEPLTSFVLPGGTSAAGLLHLSRTICRRAERLLVTLAREETVGEQVIPYLNRLSDLLFVLARIENQLSGHKDILWDSHRF